MREVRLLVEVGFLVGVVEDENGRYLNMWLIKKKKKLVMSAEQ